MRISHKCLLCNAKNLSKTPASPLNAIANEKMCLIMCCWCRKITAPRTIKINGRSFSFTAQQLGKLKAAAWL